MTTKITLNQVRNLISALNIHNGHSGEWWTSIPNANTIYGNKANVGSYQLLRVKGGNKLVQIIDDDGSVIDISQGGFVSLRELYHQIIMLLRTLEAKNDKS